MSMPIDVESFRDDNSWHSDDTEQQDQNVSAKSSVTPSTSSKKLSSDVYSFIEQLEDGSFRCKSCFAKNEKKIWIVRSTTNFRNHLRKYHSDQYSLSDPKQTKLRHHAFVPISGSKRPRHTAGGFSTVDKTFANQKLTDWIVNKALPFSVVEHTEFQEFCFALQDQYDLPSRPTVRNQILLRWQEQKNIARQKLLKDVAGHRCGITTDMWTSAAKKGYMVVTMHYIDGDWAMQSVIIAFVRVMYPHTGARLAERLICSITDMHPILLQSVWAITADNASTNPAMVTSINNKLQGAIDEHEAELIPESATATQESLPVTYGVSRHVFLLRCLAHVLQLAVKEGIKQCPPVDIAIGRFRDLVKKISDSPKLLEAFQAISLALKVAHKVPELDCETRWNSTWSMMSSVLKMQKPLEELLRRIRDRHEGFSGFSIAPADEIARPITAETWSAMSDLCSFLKPFKEATVLMSASEYPTLGMVVPVFHLVSEHVRIAIAASTGFRSTHTIRFAKAVKTKLDEYRELVSCPEVQIAACLDPRVRPYLLKIGISEENVKELIRKDYELEYESQFLAERCTNATACSLDSEAIGQSFLELLTKDSDSVSGSASQEPFVGELNRWMQHAPMTLTQSSRDVCMWFKVNMCLYPRIQRMARDYMGVTSTSVPSECAFSRAGTTVSIRRARLGDDAVQAISELQSFLSFNK